MTFGFGPSDVEHTLIVLLQRFGPLSRAALAREAGFSRSTVSTAINGMIGRGLVVEGAHVRTETRGRPAQLVTLAPSAGTAVGIDFGFRHVRGVIADVSHNILGLAEIELDIDYTFEAGLEAASAIVENVVGQAGLPMARLLGIGVGIPCPTDLSGTTTRSAMIPTWNGIRLQEILAERFALPVHVENESRMAAWGEVVWGAARGVKNFVYLKLHSGVGGAVFVNGQCVFGCRGGAGEIGHVSLDPRGPICRCGNRGCLEVYAGIPAVLQQLSRVHPDITLARLLSLYRQEDPSVCRVVSEVAQKVGQAAGMLCNTLNPELLLIGGSFSALGEPFLQQVRPALDNVSIDLNRGTRVEIATLGRNASAMGALARAFQIFGTSP
jgi:predicted NBD/HSP70 family sugar kinase